MSILTGILRRFRLAPAPPDQDVPPDSGDSGDGGRARIIELYPWAIRMHQLINEINRCGGRIESRLVSEEDIEFTFRWTCDGPTVLMDRGTVMDSGTFGENIEITTHQHVAGPSIPLSAEEEERFKR